MDLIKATIKQRKSLTHDIIEFVLEPERKVEFIPGQFVMVHIPGQKRPSLRSYSLANHPGDSGQNIIRLVVKILPQGLASEYLKNKKPGDIIEITEARGLLTFKSPEAKNIYMLATGTGLIPLLSILEHALPTYNLSPITYHLFWGNRYKVDIFWLDRLMELKNKYPNFTFQIALSKPVGYWEGAKGYITDLIKEVDFGPGSHFYLCGLPQMIDDAHKILQDKGVTHDKIFHEKYISHGKAQNHENNNIVDIN